MDTTLRQVGQLLLDAIPTVVLLLLLYAIYQNFLRKPLERVLAQRRERTEGAVAKARADVASAEARTQEYEQKLRDARLAVFKAQDARRQQAQQLRIQALAEAVSAPSSNSAKRNWPSIRTWRRLVRPCKPKLSAWHRTSFAPFSNLPAQLPQ